MLSRYSVYRRVPKWYEWEYELLLFELLRKILLVCHINFGQHNFIVVDEFVILNLLVQELLISVIGPQLNQFILVGDHFIDKVEELV